MSLSIPNSNRFENKEQVAFDTYFSYLTGISSSIESSVETIDDFLDEITNSRSFSKIQSKNSCDLAKVSKLLRNAWYTEFQLNNLSVSSDFAGF